MTIALRDVLVWKYGTSGLKWRITNTNGSIEEAYDSFIWEDDPSKILTRSQLQQDCLEYELYLEQTSYIRQRENEYTKEGITSDSKIDALWDRIMGNNPPQSDEIHSKILHINEKFPKPS